jgi:hypothetical protein
VHRRHRVAISGKVLLMPRARAGLALRKEGVRFSFSRVVQMRTNDLFAITLGLLITVWAGCLPAQEREPDLGRVPEPVSGYSGREIVPYGVPLAPPIYFVNFLFLYFSNPATAALMPAYRVPLPQQVYKCLLNHPDGCPYDQMARFFRRQAANKKISRDIYTAYPSYCQTTEPWQDLAPPVYEHPDQINEPLGDEKAEQLAQALGMDQEMILTDSEYQCVMGVPPRDPAQEILYACFIDFTASKGNGIVVPFSSYGLNLNEQGNVLSLCAPHAPCLEANKVFLRLREIAEACGFRNKLQRFLTQTPVVEFIEQGAPCQQNSGPACIAATTWP